MTFIIWYPLTVAALVGAVVWSELRSDGDPWALTAEQQADLDARSARRAAEIAAIPDEPPF